MRSLMFWACLPLLAACTPTPEVPSPAPQPRVQPGYNPNAPRLPVARDDTCGIAPWQSWVGQPVPAEISALGPVRIVPEIGVMTMDHNPQRLTVIVTPDARRTIVSMSCG